MILWYLISHVFNGLLALYLLEKTRSRPDLVPFTFLRTKGGHFIYKVLKGCIFVNSVSCIMDGGTNNFQYIPQMLIAINLLGVILFVRAMYIRRVLFSERHGLAKGI